MTLSPEIVAQLTPESVQALPAEEKRELIAILEALQLPYLERLFRAVEKRRRAQTPEQGAESLKVVGERLAAIRKRIGTLTPEQQAANAAEFERKTAELQEWRARNGQVRCVAEPTVKAEWLKLREKNPRAGGVAIDRLLGVETPPEPTVAHPVAPEQPQPKPEPIIHQRPLTAAEWAKQESERVQAEAAEFQRTDFLTQVCGVGVTNPSGKAGRRWDA